MEGGGETGGGGARSPRASEPLIRSVWWESSRASRAPCVLRRLRPGPRRRVSRVFKYREKRLHRLPLEKRELKKKKKSLAAIYLLFYPMYTETGIAASLQNRVAAVFLMGFCTHTYTRALARARAPYTHSHQGRRRSSACAWTHLNEVQRDVCVCMWGVCVCVSEAGCVCCVFQ